LKILRLGNFVYFDKMISKISEIFWKVLKKFECFKENQNFQKILKKFKNSKKNKKKNWKNSKIPKKIKKYQKNSKIPKHLKKS
jgi:hypothetical protein